MKTLCITLALVIALSSLLAIPDFSQTYVFDSGTDIGFTVRLEGEGMYHYRPSGSVGSIQNVPLEDWLWGWKQGTIFESGYVGFTRLSPDPMVNPMFSTTEPTIYFTTPLETDAIGDNVFSTNTNLDIVSSRIGFTSERLYFALKTSNESYPVSSGFTYFAYMPVIVNPAADPTANPTVYGLMYTVNLGTVISPGLYKITGTGFDDIARLGDIEVAEEDNFLVLSCALSDLFADPDFSSWYDPSYPVFATTTTTSKITLTGGTQAADNTTGIKVLLQPHFIELQNLSSPVLTNAEYTVTDAGPATLSISIDYFDADMNVPRTAYLSIDEGSEIPLEPLSTDDLDFSLPVTYGVANIPIGLDWDELRLVFSDGIDIVQHIIQNPVANSDATQEAVPSLIVYPNPAFNSLSLKASNATRVSLYNLRGQKVTEQIISKSDKVSLLDIQHLNAGIYILKTDNGYSKRILKM